MEMATITSVNPLKVRLWGAETDSLVWRISSGVTPRIGLDVLVTTQHHGLIVIADAGARPGPFYTGTEQAWPSGNPPAGALIVEKKWILTGTVSGAGGGVQFLYPEPFAGVTNIQYSPLTQNRRLTCWYWSTNQLHATATHLAGTYVPEGESVTACLTVTGWK